jgi:nucleotide-binding universal stress UspA family protein
MRDSNTPQRSVVVGIDGSQAAIQAAEWAVDEAVSREVPLRLVEVIAERVEPAPSRQSAMCRWKLNMRRPR